MIATDRVDSGHISPPRRHTRAPLVDLIPDGSATLWLGPIGDEVASDLGARACRLAVAALEGTSDGASFANVDFGRARHDAAVVPDLLGRVAEPEGLLAAIRRALKAGGLLVASVPNAGHSGVRRALADGRSPYSGNSPLDPGQLRLFTQETFAAALEAADFAVGRLRPIPDPHDEGQAVGWIAVAHALPVPGLEVLQERFREAAVARSDAEVAAESLREILVRTRLALDSTYARAEARASDARSAREALATAQRAACEREAEYSGTIRDLLASLESLETLRQERDAAHRHALAAESRCRVLEGRIEHILVEFPRRVARSVRNRLLRRSK